MLHVKTNSLDKPTATASGLHIEACSIDVEMAHFTTWEKKQTFQVSDLRLMEAQENNEQELLSHSDSIFPYVFPSSYSFPVLSHHHLDELNFTIDEWCTEFVIIDMPSFCGLPHTSMPLV